MRDNPYEKKSTEVYCKQALEHGLRPTSTMLDQITREMELEVVFSCLTHIARILEEGLNVLEVGCGNGYLLKEIRSQLPDVRLTGIDYSDEMVKLAELRKIANCAIVKGDVCSLEFNESSFDVVISERCLINLLNREDQGRAFREIHRVLKSDGYFVLIESFTDGLKNLNRARVELGLSENTMAAHNLWLDKPHFLTSVSSLFETLSPTDAETAALPPSNFLSSHYFISRVLYPCITKRGVLYNTEFVKFFRFLPPMGNYSPIQFFLLRKRH